MSSVNFQVEGKLLSMIVIITVYVTMYVWNVYMKHEIDIMYGIVNKMNDFQQYIQDILIFFFTVVLKNIGT